MSDDIKNLINRIEIIETKLDKILELLEVDCKKMSNHIDFIENVYDKVKSPFNYIMNVANTMSYSDKKTITES